MRFSNDGRYPTKQRHHKIMALVGNGFDLQLLAKYQKTPGTSYVDFYHFLRMRRIGESNTIVQKMKELKSAGKKNWSDVEVSIGLLADDPLSVNSTKASLVEIRREFSIFLDLVIDSTFVNLLDRDAELNEWATTSLKGFLKDVTRLEDLRKIALGGKKENHGFYDFVFVNFNYTPLLDNFLHLDQLQFDPHRHSTSATNFVFKKDPNSLIKDSSWIFDDYGYISTQVIHPHGQQHIPRSLLFGAGETSDLSSNRVTFEKTYWTQADLQFGPPVNEADLYIIFGCSLGQTDSWWWINVANALALNPDKAAILYWWNSDPDALEAEESVLTKFFTAAKVDHEARGALKNQVCVVSYSDESDRTWLSCERKISEG